jgi:hypothetical protein
MPRTIAFLLGAMHGLNAVMVAAISWHVLRPTGRSERVVLCTVATLIGISGAGFVPLIGTTSNDLVSSIFVLGSLLGLLKIAGSAEDGATWPRFAWSGLSIGIGLGLKYTAGIYVPGLGFVMIAAAIRRRTFAGLVVFGAAAAVGFLGLAGHHLFTLWHDFGNPTFPMLNNIFQSPYFEPESGTEGEFQARDFWQLIAYPFYWLQTRSYLVSEIPLRDWRAGIAYLAIVVAVIARVGALRTAKHAREPDRETRGLGLLIIFVVLSYFVWAFAFGNYRYAVTLEMLTGIIIIGVSIGLVRGRARRIAGAIAVLSIAAVTTVYPDWGRGRFGERTIDVRVPPLPANSLVLIATGQPVAYFIPFAEPTAQFVGIENDFLDLSQGNLLVAKVRSLMRTPDRPKFIVSVGDFDRGKLDRVLGEFGLMLGRSPCKPIWSNLENPAMSICPAVPRQED